MKDQQKKRAESKTKPDRRPYAPPAIESEETFDGVNLACGGASDPHGCAGLLS